METPEPVMYMAFAPAFSASLAVRQSKTPGAINNFFDANRARSVAFFPL
jgi:hypothetical protein